MAPDIKRVSLSPKCKVLLDLAIGYEKDAQALRRIGDVHGYKAYIDIAASYLYEAIELEAQEK